MVDQYLKEDQGLTFEVLKEPAPPAEPVEGEEAPPVETDPRPKHIFVPECVREPRMHYYRVPKLGSYLAILLEYNSCLFEASLDAAITDALDV